MSIWKYSAGRMCSLGTGPKLHGAGLGQVWRGCGFYQRREGPLPVYKTLIIQVIETAWYYCYSDGEQFISFNLR